MSDLNTTEVKNWHLQLDKIQTLTELVSSMQRRLNELEMQSEVRFNALTTLVNRHNYLLLGENIDEVKNNE